MRPWIGLELAAGRVLHALAEFREGEFLDQGVVLQHDERLALGPLVDVEELVERFRIERTLAHVAEVGAASLRLRRLHRASQTGRACHEQQHDRHLAPPPVV